MTSLHCYENYSILKAQLIAHCTELVDLSIYESTDDLLLLVAHTCKHLQTLECWGSAAKITDLSVEAIFTSCRQLVKVQLGTCNLTYRSLLAVLDNKILLKIFSFNSPALNTEDIENFKAAAKEAHMLPLPKFWNS